MAPESILKPNFRKNPVSQAQPQLRPKNYGWRTGTGKARPGGGQSRSVNDLKGPPFRPEISNKVTFTSVTKQPKVSGIHRKWLFCKMSFKSRYLLNDLLKIILALIQIWISRRILHLPTEKAQQIPMSSINFDGRGKFDTSLPIGLTFNIPLWFRDLSETVFLLCCFMGTIFLNFRP